eukprot:UN25642
MLLEHFIHDVPEYRYIGYDLRGWNDQFSLRKTLAPLPNLPGLHVIGIRLTSWALRVSRQFPFFVFQSFTHLS